MVEMSKDIKVKFMDQDEKARKLGTVTEGKIAGQMKIDLEGTFVKVNDLFTSQQN